MNAGQKRTGKRPGRAVEPEQISGSSHVEALSALWTAPRVEPKKSNQDEDTKHHPHCDESQRLRADRVQSDKCGHSNQNEQSDPTALEGKPRLKPDVAFLIGRETQLLTSYQKRQQISHRYNLAPVVNNGSNNAPVSWGLITVVAAF
jgi:hypothetical protein